MQNLIENTFEQTVGPIPIQPNQEEAPVDSASDPPVTDIFPEDVLPKKVV